MHDYFIRCDLDGSGTYNSNDELKQLCTNMVVKLELDMDVQTIDKKVSSAGNMEDPRAGNWDFQTVQKWFVSMFAPTAAAAHTRFQCQLAAAAAPPPTAGYNFGPIIPQKLSPQQRELEAERL